MVIANLSDSPIGRLIDGGRWTFYQAVVLAVATLAFFAEGMASQSMGLAMPALIREWHLPAGAFASAIAIGLLGFAAGAFLGGFLGDRLGRRPLLVGALAVLAAGTIACAGATTTGGLMVARVVQGLGLGGSLPAATAIIAEFAPARNRALALAVGIAFLPIGGLVAGGAAAIALPIYGSRAVFVLSGTVTCVIFILALLIVPESPRFLATRPGRQPSLLRTMARMGHRIDEASFGTPAENASGGLARLLDPAYRRDTLWLWAAFFCVVLAMYSQFSWVPTMLAGRHLPLASVSRAISSLSAGGIVGGIASGWMTHRFGSRICFAVLTSGAVVAAVSLSVVVASPAVPAVPLALALALLGACTSGSQTALYSVGANVYPAALRTSGIGVAVAWGRIGAVLSSYTGVLSVELGGPTAFFGLIATACIVALLAVLGISRTFRGSRFAASA